MVSIHQHQKYSDLRNLIADELSYNFENVIENKLEAVGNKLKDVGNELEAEKSSSAASKAEDQIRFTAIEAELKQKVNKIGYQDTKIEKKRHQNLEPGEREHGSLT